MSRPDETDCQIAETIIDQLGGLGRLRAMIGLRLVYPVRNGVGLRFACRGTRRMINVIQVTLDPSDTYTVEFKSVRKVRGVPTVFAVSSFSDIYAEGLRDLVESETGLALSLGTLSFVPGAC